MDSSEIHIAVINPYIVLTIHSLYSRSSFVTEKKRLTLSDQPLKYDSRLFFTLNSLY